VFKARLKDVMSATRSISENGKTQVALAEGHHGKYDGKRHIYEID
jgi:hypothetical protein